MVAIVETEKLYPQNSTHETSCCYFDNRADFTFGLCFVAIAKNQEYGG